MINRIIDFSVEHKLAVIVLSIAACIGGWWAMVTLPLDATPDLSDTQVIVYSRWDRPVLGAVQNHRVPFERAGAFAGRRHNPAWPRCHGPGVDLSVCAGGYLGQAQQRRSALVSGVEPALLPAFGARSGGGCAHRRLRAPIPGESRSEPSARVWHPG